MRKTVLVVLTALSLVLGGAALAGAALPAYKVTLKVSRTTSEAGKFLVVSGTVTGPKAAGRPITIQRRYVGGAWKTVATPTIRSNGTYSVRVETPRGGSTSFRAIKPRSSVRKVGISPTRTAKVFEWLYLANEGAFVESGSALQPVEQSLDGVMYRRSILFTNGDTSTNYKLGNLCTKFATRVGYFASGTPSESVLDLNLSRQAPGSPSIITDTYVEVNTSTGVTSSMVGTRYLQIQVKDVNPSYTAALGDPRVYCNADHLPSYDNTDF